MQIDKNCEVSFGRLSLSDGSHGNLEKGRGPGSVEGRTARRRPSVNSGRATLNKYSGGRA